MGTTLTGTTPQDTYDSLIKVTDNGPLSGSLKKLTDGLGNDSSLSLSTTAASFSGTLVVSSGITSTGTNTMLSASTSTEGLVVRGGSSIGTAVAASGQLLIGATSTYRGSIAYDDNVGQMYIDNLYNNNAGNIYFRTKTAGTAVNALTILGSGNVGIGISNPVDGKLCIAGATAAGTAIVQTYLTVAAASTRVTSDGRFAIGLDAADGSTERVSVTVNGLTFNGDTAAANALDDYEEGTFTPTIIGSTTAGTATYGGGQAGAYTKIGNVVYFQLYLGYSGGTGTGDLRIAGLPFTVPANDLPSFTFGVFLNVALTASNVPIAGGIGSTNQIYINQIPTGGGSQTAVAYDDAAVIQISGFYRV